MPSTALGDARSARQNPNTAARANRRAGSSSTKSQRAVIARKLERTRASSPPRYELSDTHCASCGTNHRRSPRAVCAARSQAGSTRSTQLTTREGAYPSGACRQGAGQSTATGARLHSRSSRPETARRSLPLGPKQQDAKCDDVHAHAPAPRAIPDVHARQRRKHAARP